jgi:hypothetical protein
MLRELFCNGFQRILYNGNALNLKARRMRRNSIVELLRGHVKLSKHILVHHKLVQNQAKSQKHFPFSMLFSKL